jgi:hypothetical protein
VQRADLGLAQQRAVIAEQGAGGGIGVEDQVGMGIEQQRRLDCELERRGMEIDILWSSRSAEGKVHHARTPRFRNRATNFRLSRILVVANISIIPATSAQSPKKWAGMCLA